MPSETRPEVREFFERYERASRTLDTEVLSSCFADQFLSLDRASAHALTPSALMAVLPRRKVMFESIGSDGLELDGLEETPLDDHHTLVRTRWILRRPGEGSRVPITLSSTFVLRREQDAWRIVLYLNHQDMGKLFSSPATRAT